MGKRLITSVNPSEILLENILIEMNGHYFCKDTAAKIVGGTKRLERLIAAVRVVASSLLSNPEPGGKSRHNGKRRGTSPDGESGGNEISGRFESCIPDDINTSSK